ncbi:MAG: leucyl/phenylalanyl-tRNA--protein transferase [Gemmobacter sp.]|jgi:leucyl/phenylalanyl-tRNA--protein transferase
MRRLTADDLLWAYGAGIFPMAEARDATDIHWVDPRRRGIIPLGGFHISRSLARRLRRADYAVTLNADFAGVLAGCAARENTWISGQIAALYLELHRKGAAHSIEVTAEGRLVGGVYGVALGRAFFGESMFSGMRDGSKIALAWLVHRLRAGGFRLFDTQFLTPHLASLGGREIARAEYHRLLAAALEGEARIDPPGYAPERHSIAQPSSQTS